MPGSATNLAKLCSHPDLVSLCRWAGAGADGRARVMPHIKTFLRQACDGTMAWLVLGSHNLSGAAWGALERGGSQLLVRSFEMSVLLLPTLVNPLGLDLTTAFSCTPAQSQVASEQPPPASIPAVVEMVTCAAGGVSEVCDRRLALPMPYSVPPSAYGEDDEAWVWDQPLLELDALGHTFPAGLP